MIESNPAYQTETGPVPASGTGAKRGDSDSSAPRLTVIIVNYNVKHFLEQALVASLGAAERVPTEIIVVDNASADGSVEMVERRFPDITVIRNLDNTGFSKANNQGIEIAKGDYILLLNPDTVVEEDTFEKVVDFMDEHPQAGGLGVKMLDGKGEFLPESKRAFPTPGVAFWKAFGFSALFPKSKTFGRYHLGFLDEDETHEVDVLAGAFMLLRKTVIDEIGGLDETFFMYGEDIDLSYRIVKAGYKNYYYPETRIIHYKGESTKKGSLNYVRIFYSAMKIFARKHFSGSSAELYIGLINLAIYLRATMALAGRLVRQLTFPVLDATLIFGGMVGIARLWERNVKWMDGVTYPAEYFVLNVPIYILLWLGAVYLLGGYDRDSRVSRIVRGIGVGTLVIAAVYGFLPEDLRYSRGMILSGAVWAVLAMTLVRLGWTFLREGHFRFGEQPAGHLLIVGSEEECLRVQGLLDRYEVDSRMLGFVRAGQGTFEDDRLLGNIDQLKEITTVFNADEVVFCGADVPSGEIISWMTRLGSHFDYKIVPRDALSVIGSNSKNTAGDLYAVDLKLAIDEPRARRSKRFLDLGMSLLLLATLPLQLIVVSDKGGLIRNIFQVLFGRKTWVGYTSAEGQPGNAPSRLPALPEGVLSPADALGSAESGDADFGRRTLQRVNLLYARDWESSRDWGIIVKSWKNLGRG